jgi:hypothetical protein
MDHHTLHELPLVFGEERILYSDRRPPEQQHHTVSCNFPKYVHLLTFVPDMSSKFTFIYTFYGNVYEVIDKYHFGDDNCM